MNKGSIEEERVLYEQLLHFTFVNNYDWDFQHVRSEYV